MTINRKWQLAYVYGYSQENDMYVMTKKKYRVTIDTCVRVYLANDMYAMTIQFI